MKTTLFLLALLAAPVSSIADAAVIRGQLQTGRVDTDTRPDLSEAIVFFRTLDAAPVAPGETVEMRMIGKAFRPGVLAVTAGTSVRFPNADPILHNAFSTSPRAEFDLGFYGDGESREHHFETPGLVRVYCNVHHGMVGYVMVLDTPYFTQPDTRGYFSLSVPEGASGTLYIWHPQAEVMRREIEAAEDESLDLSMDFTGRRLPRHLNKHGRQYGERNQRSY